jgi:hypothetical protein
MACCESKPSKPSENGAGAGDCDGGTPCPKEKPCTPCTLSSETVAKSPADRTRTKIGIGEEVDITVSPGESVTWSVTGGGKVSPTSGTKTRFTAHERVSTSTVTATRSDGCKCTIVFTVIEPTNFTMKMRPGTKTHPSGRPQVAWKGQIFVHPNDVNFYRVEVREKDSQYVGTGSYKKYTGDWHGNYPPPDRVSDWLTLPMADHTDADGNKVSGQDTVDTGDPGAAVTGSKPPFKVGSGYFPIVWQWHVGSGSAKDFPEARLPTVPRRGAFPDRSARAPGRRG